MTQSKRSKPSKQRRAASHLGARLVFYFVGAAAAVAGVAGWIIPELPIAAFPNLPWAALVLAGLTGLSALVVPITCEMLGRSWRSALFIPAALVFGGINAYSFHNAVDALVEQPRVKLHQVEKIDPLKASLEAASLAVANHVAPAFPDTMGPKNIAARMEAWNAVHAPLVAAEARAEAKLAEAPVYEPMVPNLVVWLIAGAIDLSLAATLMGVGLTRAAEQRKIDAELLAELLAKREAKRERDAAAKVEAERQAAAAERAARRAKRGVATNQGPTPTTPAPAAKPPTLRVVA